MKCSTCGVDGTITVHQRQKRKGETRVLRCPNGHSRILKKADGDEPQKEPAREPSPEPKKNRDGRTIFGHALDWLNE